MPWKLLFDILQGHCCLSCGASHHCRIFIREHKNASRSVNSPPIQFVRSNCSFADSNRAVHLH